MCELLGVPMAMLPQIVDTSGVLGAATAIPGAPPIAALAGDQQASLAGQGCVTPGQAKITFGTGGMLDICTGPAAPAEANRSANGTFPIVAWSVAGEITWGVEAVMLSAGSNIEWLRDDMGLIDSADDSHDVASKCETTDGVVYVPALLGLGHPALGLRRPRHAARPHPRLEPVAHRARRARGHRPSRRRHGGRRRGRHRPHRSRRCASTAG